MVEPQFPALEFVGNFRCQLGTFWLLATSSNRRTTVILYTQISRSAAHFQNIQTLPLTNPGSSIPQSTRCTARTTPTPWNAKYRHVSLIEPQDLLIAACLLTVLFSLPEALNSSAGCRSEICHRRSDSFLLFVFLRLITSEVQGM